MSLYLSLKFECDGMFRKTDQKFKDAILNIGIKSPKTSNKFLSTLVRVGWIWFNPKSGIYHIRGTRDIFKREHFEKSKSVRIYKPYLLDYRVTSMVTMLNEHLYSMMYAKKKNRKVNNTNLPHIKRFCGNTGGVVDGPRDLYTRLKSIDHVGMPVWRMSESFGFSKSTWSGIKKRAMAMGLIQVNKKFVNVCAVMHRPYAELALTRAAFPELSHRVRFTKNFKTGMSFVGIQVYDEIFPLMELATMRNSSKKGIINVIAKCSTSSTTNSNTGQSTEVPF